ncbi:hypothetical protein ACFFGH_28130 [Lysobacter korlensis]|uniref:Mannosylglycerate hydrolase MGH1-like glycoside hydrolase domain-containing protein n=1 Tax=Lysobacter korlensis TaxID=553636 RepID=A0ABV6RZ19_9GAMM
MTSERRSSASEPDTEEIPSPDLVSEATRVLMENWRGLYTVPASGLYPHQWSWDSAFIAVGLRHVSPRRAQQELESLLGAQWADGRLPQIVFASGRDDEYSPGASFWRSELIPGSAPVPTAGLIQPPNHAWAALLVHEADPEESRRRRFLDRAYPRLVAWHEYLRRRRSDEAGLAFTVHPWETGMDNSPAWDAPLAAVRGTFGGNVPRPDLRHADVTERPSNAEYEKYLSLAATYRDAGCDDSVAATPFRVTDPGVTALWIRSELALGRIAEELGIEADHADRAAALTEALEDLWDAELGCYVPVDRVSCEPQRFRSITGLLPLIVPDLLHVDELLGTLHGEHFRLGRSVLVPSFDLTAPEFDTSRYWRGPAWFNTAWVLVNGLLECGLETEARVLADTMGARAVESDFAEYLDPITGAAHGTRRFSWTAALSLDLHVRLLEY